MLEILLIRHGQTDWNRERRVMGDHPIGLNAEGRQQVENLSKLLSNVSFDALYCSPLMRTRESAEILNMERKLPIREEADLREIEYGEWVGKTFQEIRESDGFESYYRFPERPVGITGESLVAVCQRAAGLLEKLRSEWKEGRIACVTHADWVKCAILHTLKMPMNHLYQFRIDNASVSLLSYENSMERVVSVNNTSAFESLFLPRGPL